jgi:hypothetical protein
MRRLFPISGLLLLCLNPVQCQDNADTEHRMLGNPYFDILVVTVVSMEHGPFTDENPPKGSVKVDEVMRGTESQLRQYFEIQPGHLGAGIVSLLGKNPQLSIGEHGSTRAQGKDSSRCVSRDTGSTGGMPDHGCPVEDRITHPQGETARTGCKPSHADGSSGSLFLLSEISNRSYMRIDLFILLYALALTFLIAVPFLCSPPLTEDLA